jgi:DNA-binding transcriptional regulator YiaG
MNLNANIWRALANSIPDYICGYDVLAIRETYDLAPSEAAEYFKVSIAEWRSYETEHQHPSPELTRDLKRALVDVEFFIDKILECRLLKKT